MNNKTSVIWSDDIQDNLDRLLQVLHEELCSIAQKKQYKTEKELYDLIKNSDSVDNELAEIARVLYQATDSVRPKLVPKNHQPLIYR